MAQRKIRVLTISKPYVASAYRNKLVELARQPDMEVGLITPTAWGSQAWEDDDAPAPFPVWTRQLPVVFNGRNHFHFYRGLEAAIREFRPDILNVEEEHYSIVTWQAFRVALKTGAIPLFYTWQNIYKKYPPPFSMIERYVFRHCGAAVTGNHEATEVLRLKGYLGPVREIPQMGVEIGQFAPRDDDTGTRQSAKAAVGLESDAFWIGFAGRLVEEKGVQDLIAALKLCPPNVKAVIIGDGPFAPALREVAARSLAPGRIRFVPQVKSREIAHWLRAIDCLCLPSLTRPNWKEQFGRILIEAMAAGAVCVGSDSGEIPNVIANAGLVFPEGNVGALADRINSLAGDQALLTSLRHAASGRARQLFSNQVVAAGLADLVRQVFQNKQNKP